MEQIKKKIRIAKPDIQESSANAYARSLMTIHTRLGLVGAQDDFDYLRETEAVIDLLEKYKPNTRKNFLNAIIIALKCEGAPSKSCSEYESLRDHYNEMYFDSQKENKMSKTMQENWVPWTKYEKMVAYFGKEVKRARLRRRTDLTARELRTLGDFVMVRFYQDYPVRNDIHNVRIVSQRQYEKSDAGSENYLVRSGNNMRLVLRDYKTASTYGDKSIELNGPLSSLLRDYILARDHPTWLFGHNDSEEPASSQMITRRLQRITNDRLGRKLGSNMLRHMYLSDRYGNSETINLLEQMKKDADVMGHSVQTQQGIYVKDA
jgi:hypothetical protein